MRVFRVARRRSALSSANTRSAVGLMRYLSLRETLEIYQCVMQQLGGLISIRDLGALESAVAQSRMTFDREDKR